MQRGFNTDIEIGGQRFHVQTEDWGEGNPFLVTRIYSQGAVVKSVKTPYQDALGRTGDSDSDILRLAMKDQHQNVLDWLLRGESGL